MAGPPSIDLTDIQGMVRSGYGRQEHSQYLFFAIGKDQGEPARLALAKLIEQVRHGGHKDEHGPRVNLALSYAALGLLGVAEADAATFPREFRLGMASEDRQRILGDALDDWQFGVPEKHPELDILVCCFASTAAALETLVAEVEAKVAGPLELVHRDRCYRPRSGQEHFGFKDGISNPAIVGLHETSKDGVLPVATGEFLLGYQNAYAMIPMSPSVDPKEDPGDVLEASNSAAGRKDLGKNGTFLVYRKLEENVAGFRAFIKRTSKARVGKEDPAAEAWLASRLVGRWQSGVPIQVSPDHDQGNPDENEFKFGGGRDGTKCPIGAHIRRSNPRDALPPDQQASLDVVARHRILRRGRPYGASAPDPLPEGDDANRGIIFIGLNANIERQFEFIQQTWLNSAKFDSLYDETDPFVGPRGDGKGNMSIQKSPARERVTGLEKFVTVRGGGYFFMPSLRVLRFLFGDRKR
jgi:Dyp-type peroxidase family